MVSFEVLHRVQSKIILVSYFWIPTTHEMEARLSLKKTMWITLILIIILFLVYLKFIINVLILFCYYLSPGLHTVIGCNIQNYLIRLTIHQLMENNTTMEKGGGVVGIKHVTRIVKIPQSLYLSIERGG